MPLQPYARGSTWWAKGRVEYNGRPISSYIRESTGASDERGAKDWIAEREEAERRRHFIGEEASPLTFAGAVALYPANATMANYLLPILDEVGNMLVRDITPKIIRDLGPKLYPENGTDTWRRWVVTPARAVINNGHELLGGARCPAIKIKGYTEAERIAQDKRRKKASRLERRPGDWEWILQFREHAPLRLGALALLMFATGRRIGQCIAMKPSDLAKLNEGKVRIPGAKGHEDAWIDIPPEVVADLANIAPRVPRGWENRPANKRVFGYASSCGPLKAWKRACTAAKIDYRSPHAAGRHGFGQEHVVRQGTDAKAVARFGAWSDTQMLSRTYTHAEDETDKIHAGFRTGLVQAQNRTGLSLAKNR